MRLLIIGDIHLGIYKGDVSLKLSSINIEHIRDVYFRVKPDLVIFLGDIFHKPKVEPEFLVMFNELLSEIEVNVYMITGNHDFKEIYRANLLKAFRRADIMIIDNIFREGNLVFIPYTDDINALARTISEMENCYIFTHNSIGYNLPFEHLDLQYIPRSVLVFNGHIHQGSRRHNFINVGSVSSIDFSFDLQEIGIVAFNTETHHLEFYPNQKVFFCTIKDINDIDKFTKVADYAEFIGIRYDIKYQDEVKALCDAFKVDILKPFINKKTDVPVKVTEEISFERLDLRQAFLEYMKQNYNLDVSEYIN